MLTKEEVAARMNGNEYLKEGSRALWNEMKAAGLIAVFGCSDDLMEIRGAEEDEIGVYDEGDAFFTPDGLLRNKCEQEDCPYHEMEQDAASVVKALWCAEKGLYWTYKTVIPHVTFTINDDGAPYCRGIVFALADVPSPAASEQRP